jgi:hypothetical protein
VALRDEIKEILTWPMSDNPALRRSYIEGGSPVKPNPEEAQLLIWQRLEGINNAFYRLADEIDALKSPS